MTPALARLEEIAATTSAAFDDADRSYRAATAARTPSAREQGAVRRLRARLRADSDAADGVVGQLLLPASLDAARPGLRRR